MMIFSNGCSIEKMAMNKLGDVLAAGGTTYASDDDPELVRDAAPFSLKLMETVLAETPDHEGLLLSLTSGFTQYGYGFVQQDADRAVADDFEKSERFKQRAAKLYRRARDYGMRALENRYPGFRENLLKAPKPTADQAKKSDVPLLYWTSAAWGALIALSKDDPETIADLPQVAAMADRALKLNEAYDSGAIHSFMVSFTFARADAVGDRKATAKRHFDRAMELSGGQSAGPLLAWAEAVSVQEQNASEFKALLNQALAIRVSARAEWTLVNTILLERARWLLSRMDELIIPPLPPESAGR